MRVERLLNFKEHEIPLVTNGSNKSILLNNHLCSILQSKGKATDLKKELGDFLRKTKLKHEAGILRSDNDEIDNLIIKYQSSRVIEKSSDLRLSSSWEIIESAVTIDDSVFEHMIAVKPKADSTIARLYISEEVSGSQDLIDGYSAFKLALERTSWVTTVTVLITTKVVISYLYEQGELRKVGSNGGEDEILSQAKSNARDMIKNAINRKSSDIHVYYYTEQPCSVYMRVDKRLLLYNNYSSANLLAMLRVLFNGGNNITGTGFRENMPQEADISFSIPTGGTEKSYTLRWQSMPQDAGLKVIIRVLDNDSSSIQDLDFEGMGYADQHQYLIKKATTTKEGFIICTGTTGSGKSTTNLRIMYEMIKHHPSWAYYTVEDPIEYRIEGVSQIPVLSRYVEGDAVSGTDEDTKRKMSFNKVLKGLMRADPDVIGIGEVRDETTAKSVEDFVNTGHKMLATLHAGSSIYTFDRLNSIGIDRETLCRPDFFSLIIYQSLIPKLCTSCSLSVTEQGAFDSEQKDALGSILGSLDGVRVHNPDGCQSCNNGVKGLTVCAEVLRPDSRLLQYIRESNYVAAEKYWLEEMKLPTSNLSFRGKSIDDHMLFKIKNGEVCPVLCMEEKLDYIDLINSGRDYSFFIDKKEKRLGVVNG